MTIQDIKNKFERGLKDKYSKAEIDVIFYSLAEKYLRKDKSIIRLALHESWSEIEESKLLFDLALFDLQKGKPYQYVLGECDFMGNQLYINQNVLIPRPETEELIEWVIEDYKLEKTDFSGNIIDIGTGSGAIAIALKKNFPNTKVYALDISKEALEVAKRNAAINQVKIEFIQFDILQNDYSDLPKFDLIVSNPPYIPEKEKEIMQPEVVNNEPHKALFVPNEEPLLFYKKIKDFSVENLNTNGRIYLEIHQDLKEETEKVFKSDFKEVKAKKDISQNWRMLQVKN
ncbi:peptide chain release factor N(5)-glutamine methyltransferase [Weeksellaceae bacterium TAE3-ERU29]|nr:peptide chain release factor N(5)-glutamine methyltransferase [Weeksellaceae bacterium TAE3-ERU29]